MKENMKKAVGAVVSSGTLIMLLLFGFSILWGTLRLVGRLFFIGAAVFLATVLWGKLKGLLPSKKS